MKTIVTGSHGFLGSHMMKTLEQRGYSIIPIDHEKLLNLDELKKVVKKIIPDYIFNFSSYGNMVYQVDEVKIIDANIIGTFNLFEATKDIPYKAFIHIGSSSEYGKKMEAMKETDFLETDTFYGASKVAATYLAKAFATQYKKPIVVIRPFSVYGEGEADHRFIPKMIKAILYDEQFILTQGVHDWIHIDDFTDGLMHIIDASQYREIDISLLGQIYNIGTGEEYSNIEIYNRLVKLAYKNISLDLKPIKPSDSPMWKADITQMKELGWSPRISLDEGLERCWEYYKKKYI